MLSTIFKYVIYKIVILQYKWNLVNSKIICVQNMLVFSFLDLSWWVKFVDKNHQ
jgi:hypothetical protein